MCIFPVQDKERSQRRLTNKGVMIDKTIGNDILNTVLFVHEIQPA